MGRQWTRQELWELLSSSEEHQYANLANYRSALAYMYWQTMPYYLRGEEPEEEPCQKTS